MPIGAFLVSDRKRTQSHRLPSVFRPEPKNGTSRDRRASRLRGHASMEEPETKMGTVATTPARPPALGRVTERLAAFPAERGAWAGRRHPARRRPPDHPARLRPDAFSRARPRRAVIRPGVRLGGSVLTWRDLNRERARHQVPTRPTRWRRSSLATACGPGDRGGPLVPHRLDSGYRRTARRHGGPIAPAGTHGAGIVGQPGDLDREWYQLHGDAGPDTHFGH